MLSSSLFKELMEGYSSIIYCVKEKDLSFLSSPFILLFVCKMYAFDSFSSHYHAHPHALKAVLCGWEWVWYKPQCYSYCHSYYLICWLFWAEHVWAQINELTEERQSSCTLWESVVWWRKGVRVSCMVMKRSESQLHGDEKDWESVNCMVMKRSESQLHGDEKEWESVNCMVMKRNESQLCGDEKEWESVNCMVMKRSKSQLHGDEKEWESVNCMVMKRNESQLHGDEKDWHSVLCEQVVNHIHMGHFSAFWATSFIEQMNGSNGSKYLTTVRYYERVTVIGFVIWECFTGMGSDWWFMISAQLQLWWGVLWVKVGGFFPDGQQGKCSV